MGQSGTNSEATVVPKQEPDTDATALDASVDQDIELGGVADNTAENNIDMANATDGDENIPLGNPVQTADSVDALAATAPSKKETSLREFLGKMDEYAPIVRIPLSFTLTFPFPDVPFLVFVSLCTNPK